MSAKEIKKLEKKAKRQGWTMKRGSGHAKWYSPCGSAILTVSLSPSDRNAYRQIKRQLAKLGFID